MRDTLVNIGGIVDLLLWRDGGQRQARRNAWRAMVADNVRARERADAADAVRAATSVSSGPVSSGHGARGEGRHGHG
jgi:hypothetical protein